MKNLHWRVVLATGIILLAHCVALSRPAPYQTKQSKTDTVQFSCKEIYAKDCAGCHGAKAQGDAGPNLTDKYWLHGGKEADIANTLRTGYVAKGMISWSGIFSDKEIDKMAGYLLTLQGTDPPRAKKPEGNIYDQPKAPVNN